jgi:hypothetical protein
MLALLDPFNIDAAGVKTPDENQDFGNTVIARFQEDLVCDPVFGSAASAFSPDLLNANPFNAASITAGNAWTFPGNFTAGITYTNQVAIAAAFETYRVVAWGMKLSCNQSFTTAAGNVHICLFSPDFTLLGWSTAAPLSTTAMSFLPGYQRIPLADLIEDTVIVTGRPLDPSAHRYRSTRASFNVGNATIVAGTEATVGWYYVLVAVESTVINANAIRVEVVTHLEVIPRPTGGVIDPMPPAPHQPLVMATTKNLMAAIPPARIIADVSEQTFWGAVGDAWDEGVKLASGVADAYGWMAGVAAMFI